MGSDERLERGFVSRARGRAGVGAAVQYYRELARAHDARGSAMQLVMIYADVNRVLGYAAAGETDCLADYLAGLIGRMKDAGAEIAAIPSLTPHICEPRLRESEDTDFPYIDGTRLHLDAILRVLFGPAR